MQGLAEAFALPLLKHRSFILTAACVEPSNIDIVIITNARPEHTGGTLDEDGELTFRNAWYLVSKRQVGLFDVQ
jgi:hypothetical protein